MLRYYSLLLFLVFACAIEATLTLPTSTGYVNDYTHTLTPTEVDALDTTLSQFDKKTSTQVVVGIFQSLEGVSIEEFSIRLAEKWKVGSRENDNGALLLIFKNDRQVRIEVGYGLEGVLTDALASSIIQNEIIPQFKKGHFYTGVQAGIESIMLATQDEYKAKEVNEDEPSNLFILVPIFFLILWIILRNKGGPSGGGFRNNGSASRGSGSFGGFRGGGGGFGGGGATGRW